MCLRKVPGFFAYLQGAALLAAELGEIFFEEWYERRYGQRGPDAKYWD